MSSFFITLTLIFLLFFPACRREPSLIEEGTLPSCRLVTREDLVSVTSPISGYIWAVGFNSTILHSKDGGENWVHQKCPLETDLFGVFFLDTRKGWIVGKYGSIFRTVDGGEHWIMVKPQTHQRLFDVHFVNEKQGWSVGSWGTILHTEDGGETWIKQGSGEDIIYNSVWFVDKRQGWIVGEYGNILYTKDGGKSWIKQECKDIIPEVREDEWETPTPSLYDVYFKTPLTGWAVGLDGIIIMTEDGGRHWRRLQTPLKSTLYKIVVIEEKGWVIGSQGSYLTSLDGGKNWSLEEKKIKTRFWLRDLAFSDKMHGCAVGSLGTIIITSDGGKTWEIVSGISLEEGLI